jgi:hypothetical protein
MKIRRKQTGKNILLGPCKTRSTEGHLPFDSAINLGLELRRLL